MSRPPTGTVTLLFTDIEGSTQLWERYPDQMPAALARHDQLVGNAIRSAGGHVFKTGGDAFYAAFANATDAIVAAIDLQIAIQTEQWGDVDPIRVRAALHTGAVEHRGDDYFGLPLSRCARLLDIVNSGQILLSLATAELARDALPDEVRLIDLGPQRLRDLSRPARVFQVSHPDLASEFPTLRTLDSLPNNLPAQLTRFIGREDEITRLEEAIEQGRLVTVTGVGGAGKTRLCLQVAADVLPRFRDGVWLVELAAITDPDLVPTTVAHALGVTYESPRVVDRLVDYLKDRQILLVLDNCEHLLGACARLADHLLQHCPELHILASSREGLGIRGERVFPLASMSVPPLSPTSDAAELMRSEAVRLFADRAALVQPAFTVTEANAAAVASICARLDGLPLAIELAAARVRLLAPEEIDRRLDERFRLLTGGSRTALPRQQTLQATIDWSYELLDTRERTLLCRLSIFAGGWTLDAAEHVCAGGEIEPLDVIDLLSGLADKSLVEIDERGGEKRYRMLETVRQYARDKLVADADASRWRTRHLEHYRAFAEHVARHLLSADEAQWLERLDLEYDNIRAALSWALNGGDAEQGLVLLTALRRYWHVRSDWEEMLRTAEALLDEAPPGISQQARGMALIVAADLARLVHRLDTARDYAERGLAAFRTEDEPHGIAFALNMLGNVTAAAGDLEQTLDHRRACLEVARSAGDQYYVAVAIQNMGLVRFEMGQYEESRRLLEEGLAQARAHGYQTNISKALRNLGHCELVLGNVETAYAHLSEAHDMDVVLGRRYGRVLALADLAWAATERGDLDEAQQHLTACRALVREIPSPRLAVAPLSSTGLLLLERGQHAQAHAAFADALSRARRTADADEGRADSTVILSLLEMLGCTRCRLGQHTDGLRLLGAAAHAREVAGVPAFPVIAQRIARSVRAARTALSDDDADRALAEGRAMHLPQAIDDALRAAPGRGDR